MRVIVEAVGICHLDAMFIDGHMPGVSFRWSPAMRSPVASTDRGTLAHRLLSALTWQEALAAVESTAANVR